MNPTVQNIGSILLVSGIPVPYPEIQHVNVDRHLDQIIVVTHGGACVVASISGQTITEAEQAVKAAKDARRASQAQKQAYQKSLHECLQDFQDYLETRGKTKRPRKPTKR